MKIKSKSKEEQEEKYPEEILSIGDSEGTVGEISYCCESIGHDLRCQISAQVQDLKWEISLATIYEIIDE